jgi:inhibitor of cysteine peptidase
MGVKLSDGIPARGRRSEASFSEEESDVFPTEADPVARAQSERKAEQQTTAPRRAIFGLHPSSFLVHPFRMKPSSFARVAAAAAALLLAGCAAPAGRFADPALPIDVLQGRSFEIVLESNPTTGYSWALAKRLDNHVVTLARNEYHPAEPTLAGSGGAEVWTFVARHEGTTTIAFSYRRPWEKDPPAPTTRTFRVTVRKG